MAIKKAIFEIKVPARYLDDEEIFSFAQKALSSVRGVTIDTKKPPRILHCLKEKKRNVILVFGTVEARREDELKRHPIVLGVITDPALYSALTK